MRVISGLRPSKGQASVRCRIGNADSRPLPRATFTPDDGSPPFCWGSVLPGSYALAVAILYEVTRCPSLSSMLASPFCREVVASLPGMCWELSEIQVFRWICDQMEEEIGDHQVSMVEREAERGTND